MHATRIPNPAPRSRGIHCWLFAALLCLPLPAAAASATAATATALNIFACEPEWAALAKELLPDARITSATHADQDPHHIEARPALISALRRADLAICTGASLEAGWLPMLQQRAANGRVQNGQPGLFIASHAVVLDDIPTVVDRSQGDVHAEGNPHFHLDPERLLAVARDLADRMASLRPERTAEIRQRLLAWEARWEAQMTRWQEAARPLAGKAIVAQHGGFLYLFRWLGLRQIADLEPKPGLPPTVNHLQSVLAAVRAGQPIGIVQSRYQDPRAGRWLAERSTLPLLILPSTVTDDGATATLEGLMSHLVEALLAANR